MMNVSRVHSTFPSQSFLHELYHGLRQPASTHLTHMVSHKYRLKPGTVASTHSPTSRETEAGGSLLSPES